MKGKSLPIAAVLASLASAVAGCGGSSKTTTASQPATTAVPSTTTPAPTPEVDWSQEGAGKAFVEKFVGVVRGQGVPEAAAYEGDHHPMVFIGPNGPNDTPWNDKVEEMVRDEVPVTGSLLPKFVSQVQLVGYVTQHNRHAAACGIFTRESDDKAGELQRIEGVTTMRIITARTGHTIATRTFTDVPQCGHHFSSQDVDLNGDPPWRLVGTNPDWPENDAVKHWVDSYLRTATSIPTPTTSTPTATTPTTEAGAGGGATTPAATTPRAYYGPDCGQPELASDGYSMCQLSSGENCPAGFSSPRTASDGTKYCLNRKQ